MAKRQKILWRQTQWISPGFDVPLALSSAVLELLHHKMLHFLGPGNSYKVVDCRAARLVGSPRRQVPFLWCYWGLPRPERFKCAPPASRYSREWLFHLEMLIQVFEGIMFFQVLIVIWTGKIEEAKIGLQIRLWCIIVRSTSGWLLGFACSVARVLYLLELQQLLNWLTRDVVVEKRSVCWGRTFCSSEASRSMSISALDSPGSSWCAPPLTLTQHYQIHTLFRLPCSPWLSLWLPRCTELSEGYPRHSEPPLTNSSLGRAFPLQ